MKVILKQDVDKLGRVGDVVKVAPGYGRNFLIPRQIAVEATPGNLKIVEIERRANALASVVLPVPGKSSSSTCPPLPSAASNLRVGPAWPCITLLMLAAIFRRMSWAAGEFISNLLGNANSGRERKFRRRLPRLRVDPGFVR